MSEENMKLQQRWNEKCSCGHYIPSSRKLNATHVEGTDRDFSNLQFIYVPYFTVLSLIMSLQNCPVICGFVFNIRILKHKTCNCLEIDISY
jgi:hypothetical protein